MDAKLAWIRQHHSIEQEVQARQTQIAELRRFGWSEKMAKAFSCIGAFSNPLALALNNGSQEFAATTYFVCDALARIGRRHQVIPPPMYCHLRGPASLTHADLAWDKLLMADKTGFCGLTSSAMVTLTDLPQNFTPDGFAVCMRDGVRLFYATFDT
eukprot:445850-Prymnesium_polylepis.1